jgi:hypothetical protein
MSDSGIATNEPPAVQEFAGHFRQRAMGQPWNRRLEIHFAGPKQHDCVRNRRSQRGKVRPDLLGAAASGMKDHPIRTRFPVVREGWRWKAERFEQVISGMTLQWKWRQAPHIPQARFSEVICEGGVPHPDKRGIDLESAQLRNRLIKQAPPRLPLDGVNGVNRDELRRQLKSRGISHKREARSGMFESQRRERRQVEDKVPDRGCPNDEETWRSHASR